MAPPTRGALAGHHQHRSGHPTRSCSSAPAASLSSASSAGVVATVLVGPGRRDRRLPRRRCRRAVVRARQHLPGHPGAAADHHHRWTAAQGRRRSPIALGASAFTVVGLGRADACVRRRCRCGDATSWRRHGPTASRTLADHLVRDPAQPDRDHRRELRGHRDVRDPSRRSRCAFIGVTSISDWDWGTILFWAQNQQALSRRGMVVVRPGRTVHRSAVGMALTLINFGIDEFVDPRLRSTGQRVPAIAPSPEDQAPDRLHSRRAERGSEIGHRTTHGAGAMTLAQEQHAGSPVGGDGPQSRAGDPRPRVSTTDSKSGPYPRPAGGEPHARREGEVLGLAGESGCGKSTLVYAATRLLPPPGFIAGGEAFFHPRRRQAAGGHPADRPTKRELRMHGEQHHGRVPGGDELAQPGVPGRARRSSTRLGRTGRNGPGGAADRITSTGTARDGWDRRPTGSTALPAPAVGRHAPTGEAGHGAGAGAEGG